MENNDVRTTLPDVSDWPTFPQVFVKGELIGGADIVTQMHEAGELKKLVDSVERLTLIFIDDRTKNFSSHSGIICC